MFGVLSEIQRQTLGLHLLDGYTFEEIAVKLDQSRGNVKHHYFRGLEKLRKQIFSAGRLSSIIGGVIHPRSRGVVSHRTP